MSEFIPDIILVLSGGITKDNKLGISTKNRLDTCLQYIKHIKSDLYICTVSGFSPHSGLNTIDKKPIYECDLMAKYLIKNNVPTDKIFREWTSHDTIGNAYFTLVQFILPLKLNNIMIITSDFHMPRSKAIFEWIYGMYNLKMTFLSAPDKGIDKELLKVRIKKEEKSTNNVKKLSNKIKTLSDFHQWLFTSHDCYSCQFKEIKKIDKKLLETYQ